MIEEFYITTPKFERLRRKILNGEFDQNGKRK